MLTLRHRVATMFLGLGSGNRSCGMSIRPFSSAYTIQGQTGYTLDRLQVCHRANGLDFTITFRPALNLNSPINLTPSISLDCGQKYPQRSPKNARGTCKLPQAVIEPSFRDNSAIEHMCCPILWNDESKCQFFSLETKSIMYRGEKYNSEGLVSV